MMKISQAGIDLIKSFEGVRLHAYKAVPTEEHWTIGYGHYSASVKPSDVITQKQAENLLAKDLQNFVNGVNKYVTSTINQNQFDALVSFAYNCGLGNFNKSTLLAMVNKRDFAGASLEFDKWTKSGGKVLGGLVKRREAERKLFIKKPVDSVSHKPPAASGNHYTGHSLVDYLLSKHKKTDFASRKMLARDMGMSHYSGNSEDNTKLLGILRKKWDKL